MNRTQIFELSPYEIIKYKREQLDLMSSKTDELDALKTMGHDCKGNEDDACLGCAKLELLDDEITYHDLQIDLVNSVLESEEYAMRPDVRELENEIAQESSSKSAHGLVEDINPFNIGEQLK